MTTTPDHSALRTLAENATPGPWSEPDFEIADGDEGEQGEWWIYNHEAGSEQYAVGLTFSLNPNSRQDAAYIAAASPNVVLSLLDEIAELSEENKDMSDDLALHREELIKIHRENKALRFALSNLLDTNEGIGGTKYHAGDIARDALKGTE